MLKDRDKAAPVAKKAKKVEEKIERVGEKPKKDANAFWHGGKK